MRLFFRWLVLFFLFSVFVQFLPCISLRVTSKRSPYDDGFVVWLCIRCVCVRVCFCFAFYIFSLAYIGRARDFAVTFLGYDRSLLCTYSLLLKKPLAVLLWSVCDGDWTKREIKRHKTKSTTLTKCADCLSWVSEIVNSRNGVRNWSRPQFTIDEPDRVSDNFVYFYLFITKSHF